MSGLINETIKTVTGRARPRYSLRLERGGKEHRELSRYIDANPGAIVRLETRDHWTFLSRRRPWNSAYKSFPSGHANTAFVLSAYLAAVYPPLTPLWVTLSSGCALSRVRYKNHFPSDVLFAAALGWLTAQWTFSWGWPGRLWGLFSRLVAPLGRLSAFGWGAGRRTDSKKE